MQLVEHKGGYSLEDILSRSIEEQRIFQYYWTALTFTLLAAAIQSADLENYHGVTYVAEVLSWICLLLSGLQLLRFLEGRGNNLRAVGLVSDYRNNSSSINTTDQKKLTDIENEVDENRDKMKLAYDSARKLFIAGVCLAVAARSMHGLTLLK